MVWFQTIISQLFIVQFKIIILLQNFEESKFQTSTDYFSAENSFKREKKKEEEEPQKLILIQKGFQLSLCWQNFSESYSVKKWVSQKNWKMGEIFGYKKWIP